MLAAGVPSIIRRIIRYFSLRSGINKKGGLFFHFLKGNASDHNWQAVSGMIHVYSRQRLATCTCLLELKRTGGKISEVAK